jgi:hypothetical protein
MWTLNRRMTRTSSKEIDREYIVPGVEPKQFCISPRESYWVDF